MPDKLDVPEKVTLRWLFTNMPITGWSTLFGIFATMFGLGYKVGDFFASPDNNPVNDQPVEKWQETARKNDWIPISECPAFPVTVRITSPGSGAILEQSRNNIHSRFVVETSRQIKDEHTIYLLVRRADESNHYIADRLYGGAALGVELPFEVSEPTEVTFWALVVNTEIPSYYDGKVGEIYTDIEQVKSIKQFLALSDPVRVTLRRSE